MIGRLEGGDGDQTNLSQEIARKSEELLRCPSYLNSLFVNPKQLDTMFERLLRVCSKDAMQELAKAFERGLKGGLDSLQNLTRETQEKKKKNEWWGLGRHQVSVTQKIIIVKARVMRF